MGVLQADLPCDDGGPLNKIYASVLYISQVTIFYLSNTMFTSINLSYNQFALEWVALLDDVKIVNFKRNIVLSLIYSIHVQ